MATNTTTEKNPQVVTIRGRLSWPRFTYAEALKQQASSKYPKKDEDVKPNFNLLLEQPMLDKLVAHIKDVFLPWCEQQEKDGNKAGDKSALSAAHIKKLTRILDEQDWETDAVLGLINPVPEKTQPMAPEAAASVKVNGFKGQDLELKAVVRSESELKNQVDDIVIPPRGLIMPVADTTHDLYPGSVCAAQINLWAFLSSGNPGITASTPSVIFWMDGERFGGGGSIDEDELFMDLDD